MSLVAKVAIVSNLPQLDRLFDYQISEELSSQVFVGSRVKVPFGKGSKTFEGFVFEIVSSSEFSGTLLGVREVIGDKPALSSDLIEVIQQLALRSAASVGEILKLAVPSHMPRAFSSHVQNPEIPAESISDDLLTNSGKFRDLTIGGSRHAVLAKPSIGFLESGSEKGGYPHWVITMCSIASLNLEENKSSILAVPDFRDQVVLLDALGFLGLVGFVANYSQDQTKSKQYEAYLRALDDTPRVIIGSRSAILAPAFNLGTIAVFDEGDHSFTDQSAPYLNARDSALLRQSVQNCSIVFISHARSTDIQRLVENSYLQESSEVFAKPKISVSEPGFRVDSHAYAAIKKGLETGSVLVQVASKGESTALFCTSCDKKVLCQVCSGPVWVDRGGVRKCRWCNAFAPALACECGAHEVSRGRAGSARTASELGKSFPNSRVVESTGEKRILSVASGKNLVISTAGAEPFVEGGYRAVVLLDAQTLLSRQNLRSSEDAVRLWSNAISKMTIDGEAVLIGVSGGLAQKFCLWQQTEIAAQELASRRELMLPPAIRLGSVSGTQNMLVDLAQSLSTFGKIKVLGPAPFVRQGDQSEWRLIVKYAYSDTLEVARVLRGEAIRLSRGKSVIASSGRAVRALKVRMSDGDVV